MKEIFIIIFFILILLSCKKIDIPKGTPKCIEDKIISITEGKAWNPPAKIFSCTYNGQTVYYFPSRCCDIASTLYDENCNVICSPDGGWSGGGDGHCTDFFSSRTNVVLIWEDTRK